MGSKININSSVTDQFYRYKMPRIAVKVEGKGNGIKTLIVNMAEIGRALNRSPAYPTKFFCIELGAQSKIDDKNDKYIVNGMHDAVTLQELLDKFIKKYVLCPQCENPETDLRVSVKSGLITARCVACGWSGEMDNHHDLAKFIRKNPPTNQNSIANNKDKSASSKSSEIKSKKIPEKLAEDEKKEKESKKAGKKSGKEGKGSEKSDRNDDNDEEDEEWSVDVSEEAVRARREAVEVEASDAAKGMYATEEDFTNISDHDRLKSFKSFSVNNKATEKELYDEAARLGITSKAVEVIVEINIGENIISQIKSYKSLLLRFCENNVSAQQSLLGATERLVAITHPSLLNKISPILNLYYDLDLVEEKVILNWGAQSCSTFVPSEKFALIKKSAAPFLDWLSSAEYESDEEDDDTVAFDRSAPSTASLKPTLSPSAPMIQAASSSANDEDDDDNDLDIDNI